MRGQVEYTEISVQAYRCRWGCRHLLCLCQCHSAQVEQCQGRLLSFFWLQKMYHPYPLFVGGSYQDRGCRRLFLTYCVMQDAGGQVDQNPSEQAPREKNSEQMFSVCCHYVEHIFPFPSDGYGPVGEDLFVLPLLSALYPSADWGFCFDSRESWSTFCHQDVLYLSFFSPSHPLGMEASSNFFSGCKQCVNDFADLNLLNSTTPTYLDSCNSCPQLSIWTLSLQRCVPQKA